MWIPSVIILASCGSLPETQHQVLCSVIKILLVLEQKLCFDWIQSVMGSETSREIIITNKEDIYKKWNWIRINGRLHKNAGGRMFFFQFHWFNHFSFRDMTTCLHLSYLNFSPSFFLPFLGSLEAKCTNPALKYKPFVGINEKEELSELSKAF